MPTATAPKKKATTAAPRFKGAVNNILTILASANEQELSEGKEWYRRANTFAKELAGEYNTSLEIVAGIISALSPASDWNRNKIEAIEVLKGNREFKFATYGVNADKAFRIAALNPDADVAALFPANKTRNFYQNIVNPSNKLFVTIDRHALSIALGFVRSEKSISNSEYKELAKAYNQAAKKAKLLPCEVQSISWELWRSAKGYKAKFTITDFSKVRELGGIAL